MCWVPTALCEQTQYMNVVFSKDDIHDEYRFLKRRHSKQSIFQIKIGRVMFGQKSLKKYIFLANSTQLEPYKYIISKAIN